MTDQTRDPGRIDLRAIDEPADPNQAERVIAAVRSRKRVPMSETADVLAGVAAWSRPILAAAAALLLAATATLLRTRERAQDDQPVSVVASWAESSYVPTNGELLAAFQGYGR